MGRWVEAVKSEPRACAALLPGGSGEPSKGHTSFSSLTGSAETYSRSFAYWRGTEYWTAVMI